VSNTIELVDLSVSGPDGDILSGVSLDLPETGLVGLVGPMGSGKSTLLRFLAGKTEGDRLFAHCEVALCQGRSCAPGNWAILIPQRPREAARDPEESRRLAAIRTAALLEQAALDCPLICVDEPTAGLFEDEARAMVDLLLDIARSRLVLMATHHLHLVTTAWARVVLLGKGRVLSDSDAAAFLADQSGHYAEHFRRTSGLVLPDEQGSPHALDPSLRRLPAGLTEGLIPAEGHGWIIRDAFWYGPGVDAARGWGAEVEYRLDADRLSRRVRGQGWQAIGAAEDARLIRAAREITDRLAAGGRVLPRPRRSIGCSARFSSASASRPMSRRPRSAAPSPTRISASSISSGISICASLLTRSRPTD